MQILQDQIESTSSEPHFSKLFALPSDKNIERFHSRKKQLTCNNKLSKPNEWKISILETINNHEKSSQNEHNDFDHIYHGVSLKLQ